ncbi:elongation factor P [Fuchsiella alkaliacetigena]|uniref:elongation factor P n=1 Tax=Fuchsiella alkaliacetigena TaxID=957042 RepID=UPI00200B4DB6|nr:elongation factor P [Fuchsiella alkaliacetigena]MCK8825297.1 elongation factor P [Fuchsiella alkaliacetigena]
MISTNDFQTGMTIELDGELYTILDYDHVKPGKGGAFIQTELKNIDTGSIINKRFRSGEKVAKAHIEAKKYQFLYRDGDNYVFMDNETYEQIELAADMLGNATDYLKENLEIEIEFYQEKVVGVKVPNFVELAVADAPPAIKGNTVSGGSKKVTLESGAEVKVPLFIEAGDILKIDTRSGEYIERV